jgi:hypothetical protein
MYTIISENLCFVVLSMQNLHQTIFDSEPAAFSGLGDAAVPAAIDHVDTSISD